MPPLPLAPTPRTKDWDISAGTTRVLYAYGDEDPASDEETALLYHGSTQR